MARPSKKKDDFDVDAAMAAEGISLEGFDVDAAMKAEGIAAPKSDFSNVKPGSSSTADAPESRGAFADFADFITMPGRGGQKPTAMASGLSALSFLGVPFGQSPRTPEQASTRYNNFTDIMLAGQADRIRDTVNEVRPGNTSTPEERDRLDRENPSDATMGKAAGVMASVVGGPAKLLDTASRQGLARVAPGLFQATAKGAPMAARAAGVAKRVVGTATASGVAGGAGAALEGGDKQDVKYSALIGSLFGAGGQLVGEGLGAVVEAARKSPWIAKYLKHKEMGTLAEAEADTLAGRLDEGRPGIKQAASRARDEVFARDEQLTEQAQGRYRGRVEPEKGKPVDVAPIRQQVLATGARSRPLSSDSVESIPRSPGKRERPATPIVKRGKQVLSDLRNDPTVEDALFVRKGLDDEANFGATDITPETRAAREMRASVREGVRKASPEVAAADDEFTTFKRTQNRRNDILTGREEGGRLADAPLPKDEAVEASAAVPLSRRVPDELATATRLGRIGDQSEEGLRFAEYLDELAKQDPAFARALNRLEAKKAYEATRFSLTPAIQGNLDSAVQQGGWKRVVGQQGNAAGARLLLPAVPALEAIERGAGRVGPVAGGAMGRRDKKKKK